MSYPIIGSRESMTAHEALAILAYLATAGIESAEANDDYEKAVNVLQKFLGSVHG